VIPCHILSGQGVRPRQANRSNMSGFKTEARQKLSQNPGGRKGSNPNRKSSMLKVPETGSQPLAFITEQGWTAGFRKACTRWAQDIVGSEFASIGISMVRPTVGR